MQPATATAAAAWVAATVVAGAGPLQRGWQRCLRSGPSHGPSVGPAKPIVWHLMARSGGGPQEEIHLRWRRLVAAEVALVLALVQKDARKLAKIYARQRRLFIESANLLRNR